MVLGMGLLVPSPCDCFPIVRIANVFPPTSLYSFFDNYDQSCLATKSCQENIVSIEQSSNIHLWGLSTKASTNMVTLDGKGVVDQKDNRSNFCSTIALFSS
jgi:glucan 1,3-beta-glucosidase